MSNKKFSRNEWDKIIKRILMAKAMSELMEDMQTGVIPKQPITAELIMQRYEENEKHDHIQENN